jgi:acyl carrier protein
MTDIRKKVEEIIYSVGMEVKEDLSDQLDSLSFVTIIVEIEQAFGIEVPDDRLDFTELNTISGFTSLVQQLLNQENPIST